MNIFAVRSFERKSLISNPRLSQNSQGIHCKNILGLYEKIVAMIHVLTVGFGSDVSVVLCKFVVIEIKKHNSVDCNHCQNLQKNSENLLRSKQSSGWFQRSQFFVGFGVLHCHCLRHRKQSSQNVIETSLVPVVERVQVVAKRVARHQYY